MMKKSNWYLTLGILLIGGIAFYLINYFCPLRNDDYMYMFLFLNKFSNGVVASIDTTHPISTISDVITSQYNHFMAMNGRTPVHFLVQAFIGVWGKGLYNICAALMFMLLWHGSVLLVKSQTYFGRKSQLPMARQTVSPSDYIIVGALLWLLLPCFNCLYNGIDFSINYLWSCTLGVFFILAFNRYFTEDSASVPTRICLFLFAILTGWMHEAFTIPLSGTLFFYAIYRRGHLSKTAWCLTIGLWIGTSLIVFAPGTLHRGGSTFADFNIQEFLAIKMDMIRYSKRFYLLCFLLLVGVLLLGKKEMRKFIGSNSLMLTTIVLGMAFIFMINHYSQRMQFFTEYLSIIVALRLLDQLRLSPIVRKSLCAILALLALIHVPATIYYTKVVNDEFTRMLEQYKSSPDGKTTYRIRPLPPTMSTRVVELNDMEIEMIGNAFHHEMEITYIP